LDALDREFDECFAWWGKVYDPDSGGCFYALSGKRAAAGGEEGFGPDIEASSKLVRVLEWTGLINECPESFKKGMIRYMQERQDPESGFFRDPQHKDSYTHRTLSRATGMARNSLDKLGAEPLYPLPFERVEENAEAAEHYAHVESPEALVKWLEDLPWQSRVWTAGSHVLGLAGELNRLPEPQRSELLEVAARFVAAQQHSNGFFGTADDHWTSKLSGTYKIASFFDKCGLDVPRSKELAQTVVEHLFSNDYRNSIVLYNTANVLNILHGRGADFSLEQRLDIVARCTEILHTMRASDGGFVTHRDHPSPEANGKLLAKNVVESNTNATGLMHKTRMLLIELLTGKPGPHGHARGGDLVQALRSVQP
jgi:hypothetical protein